MRGTVAKRIRSKARHVAAKNPTVYLQNEAGTIFCQGFRRVYQDMKRKHGR